LKPFLYIQGGNFQHSRFYYMKEHRLRIPEIDRDLKIDLRRPSVGARKIADF